MVERYTRRDPLTNAVYENTDSYSIREKLARYEETGYEPEEIVDMMVEFNARIEAMKALVVNSDNFNTIFNICNEMGNKVLDFLEARENEISVEVE